MPSSVMNSHKLQSTAGILRHIPRIIFMAYKPKVIC